MKVIIFLIVFLYSLNLNAQQMNPCGQHEMERILLSKYPDINYKRDNLENYTFRYYEKVSQSKSNQIQSDTILYIIPVVFHIMHDFGPENISKAQIQDVVRIINEYFQKRNADTVQILSTFQQFIGDGQIEFRLAKKDPLGNCTDGITRHQTYLTNGGNDLLKSIVQWPPNQYLNIWVENETLNNFSAYAYLPGIPAALDGIVIMHNYVGSIGSAQGNGAFSLLAHEAGHYLNLLHTWGPTNNPGVASNCSVDDQVSDTPNCIGGICNLYAPACTSGDTANVQNMMDYCSQQMFTQGQVIRMHAALNSTTSNRNNLWSPGNLLSTGTLDTTSYNLCPPIAYMTNKKIRICAGDSITFNNDSYGGDYTSTLWQFTGANIISSTDINPTVTYNNAGIYDVTLTVENSAGQSTIYRNELVEVVNTSGGPMVPIMQGFENLNLPSQYWDYENEAGTYWETTSLASFSGTHSIYLQRDSLNSSTRDIFFTESYNLSNVSSPIFSFKMAFANTATSNDKLKIFMSTDCGKTWIMKYSKSGVSLQTSPSTAPNFIPIANEWRNEGMNINSASLQDNVRFMFEFTSNGGNNIFIDDISISGTSGIEGIDIRYGNITIYPNPAKNEANLSIELHQPSIVSYSIADVTGRTIIKSKSQKMNSGNLTYEINLEQLKGLYFVHILINNQKIVRKLICN